MPRSDAVRNRERVLAAAEEAFGETGTGASTEEIARRAGVGAGTLFRHFPTKEALLEAVFVARLRRLADRAVALGDAADPGVALRDLFAEVVAESATKNAYADALDAAAVSRATGAVGAELRDALGVLLDRAQREGVVRSDLGVADLLALLVGTSRAVERLTDDASRERVISVILDGLVRA